MSNKKKKTQKPDVGGFAALANEIMHETPLPKVSELAVALNPIEQMTRVLYASFDHFNKVLANGELKTPCITIQTRGRKRAYGWHWKDTWSMDNKLQTEINICAEYLARPLDDVLETLIHEMAHLWNSQRGIKDCNALQWHNRKFKSAAEALSLKVEKLKGRGYALTSLGEKAQAALNTLPIDRSSIKPFSRVEKTKGKPMKFTFLTCTHKTKADFKALKLEMVGEDGMSGVDFLALIMEQALEHRSALAQKAEFNYPGKEEGA